MGLCNGIHMGHMGHIDTYLIWAKWTTPSIVNVRFCVSKHVWISFFQAYGADKRVVAVQCGRNLKH
jgi:hypothetical protein